MTDQVQLPPPATAAIAVEKADLVNAWALLENLAVSLDQIGGALDAVDDRRRAIHDHLTPELVQAINRARIRLSTYLNDAETEAMSEHVIAYWDYKGMKKGLYGPDNAQG